MHPFCRQQPPDADEVEAVFPTLSSLCLDILLANLDALGDVGDTDWDTLEILLRRCNMQYVRRIEDANPSRDLSRVTEELWRGFYSSSYGRPSMEAVLARMKRRNVTCKWRDLFDAKGREVEEKRERGLERLREKSKALKDERASRQVQVVDVVPVSAGSNRRKKVSSSANRTTYTGAIPAKRPFSTPSALASSSGSSILKKSKTEYATSAYVQGVKNQIQPRRPSFRPNSSPLHALPTPSFRPSTSSLTSPTKRLAQHPTSSPRPLLTPNSRLSKSAAFTSHPSSRPSSQPSPRPSSSVSNLSLRAPSASRPQLSLKGGGLRGGIPPDRRPVERKGIRLVSAEQLIGESG
eukprot:TRINITY_DN2777_c2_g4_i1.p1 TRINITY_DN2777_c2_g4~~TRINITY_DN2777_c2_g4_i1.p1  ORF type:complete len:351 (-),score=63.88 TRINITY_DN2777_c2_g4_i1:196-1248(-)